MTDSHEHEVSWRQEDGGLVLNMRNLLMHTREVLERLQLDMSVGVSFTDIASPEETAAVVHSGSGIIFANHIAMMAAGVLNANYSHEGTFAPLIENPPYAAESIYPLEAWDKAREIINAHVAGASGNIIFNDIKDKKEIHAILMTTYHVYAWKITRLNRGGFQLPRP